MTKLTKPAGFAITRDAVERQLRAMNAALYDIGLFKPDAGEGEPVMLPRTWEAETILRSLSWLRWQNSQGRNIFIRPAGEHRLTLIDDLTAEAVRRMDREGFGPSVVVETSPRNFQVWVDHGQILPKDLSTVVARALADRFGGDKGAADWRHFGRLAGFANRKPNRRLPSGHFPFVHLVDAREHAPYPQAHAMMSDIRSRLAMHSRIHSAAPCTAMAPGPTIEDFRRDPRYCGDGNRIDLAYAVYACAHGASNEQIRADILTRDLAKKGPEKRQEDYIVRTIAKARLRSSKAR